MLLYTSTVQCQGSLHRRDGPLHATWMLDGPMGTLSAMGTDDGEHLRVNNLKNLLNCMTRMTGL